MRISIRILLLVVVWAIPGLSASAQEGISSSAAVAAAKTTQVADVPARAASPEAGAGGGASAAIANAQAAAATARAAATETAQAGAAAASLQASREIVREAQVSRAAVLAERQAALQRVRASSSDAERQALIEGLRVQAEQRLDEQRELARLVRDRLRELRAVTGNASR